MVTKQCETIIKQNKDQKEAVPQCNICEQESVSKQDQTCSRCFFAIASMRLISARDESGKKWTVTSSVRFADGVQLAADDHYTQISQCVGKAQLQYAEAQNIKRIVETHKENGHELLRLLETSSGMVHSSFMTCTDINWRAFSTQQLGSCVASCRDPGADYNVRLSRLPMIDKKTRLMILYFQVDL